MKMNEITIGEHVTIKDMNPLNQLLKRRLLALGCAEGCEICIKQKGILGGPCTFEANGQYISIRNCDACEIVVERNG